MKDVAKEAGVSLSTVSNTLSGNVRVTEDTRKRVVEASQRLNYQKNGIAADLKSKTMRTIALIVDDLAGPFFSQFIQGIQRVALDNRYDVVACSALGQKDSMGVKFLQERRASGAIVFASDIAEDLLIDSARRGLPIVAIDRMIANDHLVSIAVDNFQGGYLATKHLIDLGHKHIAYIAGSNDSVDDHQRFLGFQRALAEHGLSPHFDLRISGDFTENGGYRAIKTLVAQKDLPTAIFFANDEMAIGGLRALAAEQISVPQDVSVVGFDDIVLARYVSPGLTTVRQPIYEMGALAMNILLTSLLGSSPKTTVHKLPCELILRDSCQRLAPSTLS
ncbi:MAG: LacI family transcriptional regulator [Firmicutes bacterium]|jgi:LacI family transcriptional regulator|nr:LacI family transcriptional regulator [Bacillota bacterium]MCL5065518.1 LacI family transcriptional regulator [Bacillota bacterium]